MGVLSDSWGRGSRLGRDYYGGSDGANYRRQEEAYGRALRQLRYKARRGDTSSALGEIKLREEANERGFTPGGIRDRSTFNQQRVDASDARIEAADAMKRRNALDRLNINEDLGLQELRRRREEEEERRRLTGGDREVGAATEQAADEGPQTFAPETGLAPYASTLSRPATQGAGRGTPVASFNTGTAGRGTQPHTRTLQFKRRLGYRV